MFNQSSPITRQLGQNAGNWDTDIDSNGDITFSAMTFDPVTISPYTVQLLVTAGTSSGNLDASVSGFNTALTVTLRIRITGNGVGTSCITPSFSASIEGEYQYVALPMEGQLYMYSGTGGSQGTNAWLTVPALTGSICSGQESTINSLLGFGGSQQGLRIDRVGAFVPDGPQGS